MSDAVSLYTYEDLKKNIEPLHWKVQVLEGRSDLPSFTAADRAELGRARYALMEAFEEGSMAYLQALRDRTEDLGGSVGDLCAEHHALVRRVAKLEKSVASMLTKKEGVTA